MNYGYARSSLEEGLQRQVKILKKKNLDEIIEDRTGEKLSELIDSLKPGDSLYITHVNVLSIKTPRALDISKVLLNNNVNLYIGRDQFKLSDLCLLSIESEHYRNQSFELIKHYRAYREKQKETE